MTLKKLRSLKAQMGELLASGDSVALWLSGGADSRLLLEVLIEIGKPFGILRFEDGWDKAAKQAVDALIIEKRLQVYSYPAIEHALAADGAEITLVSRYAVDRVGNTAMLGRDLVDDPTRCAVDLQVETANRRDAPIEYDVHIWGSRSSDRHWLKPDGPISSPTWQVGRKTFIAPLAAWKRSEVLKALDAYRATVPEVDTGDIRACSRCLRPSSTGSVYCPKVGEEISVAEWNREEHLQRVRQWLA